VQERWAAVQVLVPQHVPRYPRREREIQGALPTLPATAKRQAAEGQLGTDRNRKGKRSSKVEQHLQPAYSRDIFREEIVWEMGGVCELLCDVIGLVAEAGISVAGFDADRWPLVWMIFAFVFCLSAPD
jgi:hypothetical protein